MPDISPSIPVAGQPNSTEEPKIVTALTQLVAAVNDIDNAQISASAGIVDTKLASPNNAIWRTLAEQPFSLGSFAAGTYWFNSSGIAAATGGLGTPMPVQLDPAEYVVAGKTAMLRLRVTMFTGGAPGTSPAFGVYGVGTLTGTTSIGVPLLTALTGSTVTFTTPAANTQLSTATSAFSFPGAAGQYVFGVNLPGATSASSAMMGRLQLAISHT